MAYNGIPKGNAAWALVLGFAIAVAALLYGLWLISPRELAKFVHKNPVQTVGQQSLPVPPPPPPLPAVMQAE